MMAEGVRPIKIEEGESSFSRESSSNIPAVIRNGVIVELFKKNRRLSWQSMMEIYQEEFPDAGFSVTLNLYRKIKRLYDKSQKLRGTELNNLREGAFTLLVDRATYISTKLEESPRKKVMRQELETVNTENRVLKRKFD